MSQVVTFCDRRGYPITEVICSVDDPRWIINGTGSAKITIPITELVELNSSGKLVSELILYGNIIMVEWDTGAEPWGGVIRGDTIVTSSKGAVINLKTADVLLSDRKTLRAPKGTVGSMFSDIIAQANEPEDTRIVVGTIEDFGGSDELENTEDTLLSDMLTEIVKRGGEYAFIPRREQGTGRLYFEASFYRKMGQKQVITLRDGNNSNIKMTDDIFTEQGEVANDIDVKTTSASGSQDKTTTHVDDSTSKSKYGFRYGMATVNANAINETADTVLTKNKDRRLTFKPVAIADLQYCNLGDIVGIKLVRSLIVSTTIRIKEKRYNVQAGEMPLIADEDLT